MNYTPLSSFNDLPNQHEAPPAERDPWFVWAIAASPIPPLVTLMAVGSASHIGPVVLFVTVLLATTIACVALARRDAQTNSWLAIAPAAFLLVRASRRSAGSHRGNPLWPLILNLALGFIAVYYVALFLAAILSIVNRS